MRIAASNYGAASAEQEEGEIDSEIEGIRRRLLIEHIETSEDATLLRLIPSVPDGYDPAERDEAGSRLDIHQPSQL